MSATERVRPIVVGFDGSDAAGQAVTWAARVAASRQAPLVVLHAADMFRYIHDAGTSVWDPEDIDRATLAGAERGAELARAAVPDIEVSTATSMHSGALALEDLSADAQLVVVGNTGRGRVAGIILGSTAFHVATRAECPVVVVPEGAQELPGAGSRVAVATDGSPSGSTAVKHAAAIAARYGAPLQIITAWEPAPYDSYGLGSTVGLTQTADLDAQIERAAERIAEAAVQDAVDLHPGLQVSTTVAQGRAVDVIARESAGAAVLVVGARGRGDLKSLLLGSTSRAVLHLATCPVEIVR